jgi:hypothetical protein
MRADQNRVISTDNVMRKMVARHENGDFNVDVQNVSKIDLEELATNHFDKLPDGRVEAHSDFNEGHDICHGLLEHILRDHHTAFAHEFGDALHGLGLLANEENRGVAHCIEHPVEDKDILESTDPDAVIDPRRRGIEYSMDSDRPGMLIRRKLMELLTKHGEAEVHR